MKSIVGIELKEIDNEWASGAPYIYLTTKSGNCKHRKRYEIFSRTAAYKIFDQILLGNIPGALMVNFGDVVSNGKESDRMVAYIEEFIKRPGYKWNGPKGGYE